MAMISPLPVRDGVGATRLHLPMTGPWATVGDYMAERFFHLSPELLFARFDRSEIIALDGTALTRETPLGAHEFIWYYREPAVEREIPFDVQVLYQDRDLVVADKPHFLPTTPGGKYLQNSALVRLRRQLDLPELAPIHRLDRATAGLVMFTVRPEVRGAYQLLFERREVEKVYEAVSPLPDEWDAASPALAGEPFPIVYRNHIEKLRGNVCVRADAEREPNSETLVELIDADDRVMHTLLRPHSGKMHQLRVHLAALGAGILNDSFYPELLPEAPDNFGKPLQLLARELRFIDPLSGAPRDFATHRTLQEAPASAA
ncbi:Ribosomal large subunit pseudouridine synthase A [Microbacterium esteraromaticum]|uniref:RNA pseudouridylate synthase n=2 Tax=Microbacterium esteraromaticum TaxID=57043 RepID=A0A1R4JTZ6_9MICO|nr:Ribosomal large subunit pseudouridine synthase A [Microbacterium esteraromaticum]